MEKARAGKPHALFPFVRRVPEAKYAGRCVFWRNIYQK